MGTLDRMLLGEEDGADEGLAFGILDGSALEGAAVGTRQGVPSA